MPKSKNKRKRGKQRKRNKSRERPSTTPKSVAASPQPPTRKKVSIKEALLADQGASLYRFSLYFPLLIGAWCASGIVLRDVIVFAIITISIALSHFYSLSKDREDVPFTANLLMLLQAAQVVLVVGTYHLTKHPGLVGALAVVAVLSIAEQHVDLQRVRGVLIVASSNLIRCSLYGVLGVLSQVHTEDLGVYLVYALYGFPVACLVFAYLVIRNAKVFLASGWKVQREVRKKDGSTLVRPGSLSQLYAFALMIGPAIPCALVPFRVIPTSFLLLAISFLVLPKLAEAQFNKTSPTEVLATQTVMSSTALALLSLLAGVLARYGIFV